jgi:hypothetical protein
VKTGYCLVLVVLLVGCGGGGGGNEQRVSDVDGDGIADTQDCAAADSMKSRLLGFQSIDSDGDSYRVNSSGELCVGNALPSTHFAASVGTCSI